jgi:hypothetical protein
MADTVTLLGRVLPISMEPGADGAYDNVLKAIREAVDHLNDQFARGELSPTVTNYIGALRGLGVGANRSFTPCKGTCDENLGDYIYFVGAADVAANHDGLWYASTIIHDGGHAWLSQQGQPSVGLAVEKALTQVQIDYYTQLGSRPTYITNLQTYMSDDEAINARIAQNV